MAPRKNAEKARVKPVQVTPKKGVRKRTITATTPTTRNRKISASADSNLTQNHSPTQNETLKTKKTQRKKKSEIDANQDTTQNDVEAPQLLSPKKVKASQKLNVTDIKVMLANEVVEYAFKKKPLKTDTVKTETVNTSKRGRAKKATTKLQDYVLDSYVEPKNNLEHDKNIQDVAKKKVIKVINRKRPANSPTKAPCQDNKPEVETIPNNSPNTEVPKKKKRLSLRRKITPNSPKSLKKPGKAESTEALLNATPAIVSESPKLDSMPELNGPLKEIDKPSKINRKSSITSSSTCLSWTKDISSSSTTTCVTVQSNDFVRIDNKLPIVKLNNIDSKVKKQDNNANILFEENSIDSHSKKPISESSNISTADLNVSQILNLSTSSLTSVTTNKTQNIVEPQTKNVGKNDIAVKKLQQSLDNLSSKMKHFDLEIINWIGYDEEIKDSKTIEYHTRILEVLKEENDIIKYCKQIKKVLSEDDGQSFVDIENEPNNDVTPGHNATSNFTPPEAQTNKGVHNDANDKVPSQEKLVFTVNNSSQAKEDSLNHSDSRNDKNPVRSSFVEPSNESRSLHKSYQTDHTEDDDAISLFAESITGWETSKRNSTISKSIDTVDNEKTVTNTKLQISPRFERVRPPSDTEDELEECADVRNKITNGISEENKAKSSSFFNKFADKSIFNHIQNATDRLTSPLSSWPNSRFHLPNNINKSANVADSSNQFSEYHNVAAVHQNLSSTFSERFPDLKKFQIKVPVSSSDNCSRRCELITNTDGAMHNSLSNFNKNTEREEVDATMTGNGLESRINQMNEAIKDPEQVRVENSGIHVTEQITQSPMVNKAPYRGSIVFNCCIFYLVTRCRKVNCQFSHESLAPETLSAKLKELSEQIFVKESMFLISKTMLMYKYGMCYVQECIRRNLTSVLLRITVTFIAKVNKTSLVVEVVEATLLYMNGIDFESCMVMLQCEVGGDMLLCDYFMKVISETQNFSRFKVVFIKLAAYMCRIGRSFALDVATQLLERVCILAYDDVLAAALIEIMQKTDVKIFVAPMMGSLEKKLCGYNAQLYEQLMSLKAQAGLVASPQSPRVTVPVPQTSTPIANTASPDNSTAESGSNHSEPTITRTIFNHTASVNTANLAASSDSTEDLMKNFELRNMPRWRNHPGYIMRPQRKVFQRNWHAPRGYSGTPPRFRRPPPPPGC